MYLRKDECDAWVAARKAKASAKRAERMRERLADPDYRERQAELLRAAGAGRRAKKGWPSISAMNEYARHRGVAVSHVRYWLRNGLPHDGSGNLDHASCDAWLAEQKVKVAEIRGESLRKWHRNTNRNLPPTSVLNDYSRHSGISRDSILNFIHKGLPYDGSGNLDFQLCDAWLKARKIAMRAKSRKRLEKYKTNPTIVARCKENQRKALKALHANPEFIAKVSEQFRALQAKRRAKKGLPSVPSLDAYAQHRGVSRSRVLDMLRKGMSHDGSDTLNHAVCDAWVAERAAKSRTNRSESAKKLRAQEKEAGVRRTYSPEFMAMMGKTVRRRTKKEAIKHTD